MFPACRARHRSIILGASSHCLHLDVSDGGCVFLRQNMKMFSLDSPRKLSLPKYLDLIWIGGIAFFLVMSASAAFCDEPYNFSVNARKFKVAIQVRPGRKGAVTLHWRGRQGGLISRGLAFPKGWWAPGLESLDNRVPGVLWSPDSQTHLLAFIGENYESGNWEYKRVSLYLLKANSWSYLTIPGKDIEFSNRGSFYVTKNFLYIWDIEYDQNYAHMAPHKYRIRKYSWSHHKLKLISSKLTRKRYHGVYATSERNVKAQDDPLREIGLRWKWWAAMLPKLGKESN